MEIKLYQRDIERAIEKHLNGMGIHRPIESCVFTKGRKGNSSITADIVVSDKPEVTMSAEPTVSPGCKEDNVEILKVDNSTEEEESEESSNEESESEEEESSGSEEENQEESTSESTGKEESLFG